MSAEPRMTVALVGGSLAAVPSRHGVLVSDLSKLVKRHPTAVLKALRALADAGALNLERDPADGRRWMTSMSDEQRHAWLKDGGATVAAEAIAADAQQGKRTDIPPRERQAAAAPLRFAVWSDGAIAIEGLARRQLTLPAAQTGELAQLFATFPEGALQRLLESPLKPAFALHVAGREHSMTSDQAAELIAYIEQLPARSIRALHVPDNRVHRIEVPEDEAP